MNNIKSLLFLCMLLAVSLHAQCQLKPLHLTCEYLETPIGIDIPAPSLSWTFTNEGRDQRQTSYEIFVSDRQENVSSGNVWRSGKVHASQNIHIEYGGAPLKSFTRYFWKVKVYDQKEVATESSITWFETAMLTLGDWKAQWITDGSQQPSKEENYYIEDPMPLFRKQFDAKTKIVSARLYVTGAGYFEASLNGKKIGDHVLDPGWTTYQKQMLYVVHDVTGLVTKGKNTIGFMAGNGWWNPLPMKFFGRWDLRDYQQTGRPCIKAEIHLIYTDGSTAIIATDESWTTTAGPVVKNNVYLGEHYDARLEKTGWDNNNSKNISWKKAVLAKGPEGILTAQLQPAIKVTKILKPVSIVETGKDTFIIDMGQNFAGVARLHVKGSAGKKITMRYGEALFKNGALNVMTTVATQLKKGGIKNGPGAPETAWQEDSYTLKGGGVETWSPRFTFHGFRYVEVTGWPGKITVNDIEGLRMNSDLPVTGTFSCSNQMFNHLHDVIQWTFLSNVFSVQSDCPGREKMGYGADMVVSSEAFLFNYDMSNFYRKAVRDFANEQRPMGGITEIAPFTGIADRGYGDLSGPMGWQLGFPYLQKKLYEFYGDQKIIADNYAAVTKQITFLKSQEKDHLFYWDIGDHESLDPKPESFSASCFYYHHLLLAAEFAGILGKKSDSVMYHVMSGETKRSIIDHFFVPGTGKFDLATPAAQTIALWYDLSPEKENTFKILQQELERHQWHVSSGIFGTKMFFDVARRHNRNDLGYLLADQKDFPGWGFMLEYGATTLWESWNFPGTVYSMNHPMFGSVDEWFYRSLLGINSAAPGFKKIIIKPQPAGDLTWAKGSYLSAHGKIESDWKAEGENFTLRVVIPANTTADIWIPSEENAKITEGNTLIKSQRYEKGYALVTIGSGEYIFKTLH